MKRSLLRLAVASAVMFTFSVHGASAQEEPERIEPAPAIADGESIAHDCRSGSKRIQSGDYSELAARDWRLRDVCPDCGGHHGIGNGRIRGFVHDHVRRPVRDARDTAGYVGNYAWTCLNSGQPLIDPAMRADWIAQQRSATRSWHAGYYHTEYGVPVSLVVPPTVRAHTRWSWGVAQSTMSPLYHQFERPYPGPAVGGGYGDAGTPLRPTPRWPSHTDQFGVYYVRGPW